MAATAAHSRDDGEPLWSGSGSGLGNMPVVLTPARLRQPQSQVPASVTVIDRELIEASGARELYQVLQLVPGMSAVKADGNVPTVAYHGTLARDERRMLVLVDGRAHYQPGLARVLWNDLSIAIEDVERIEVTRGPASAAYGANAFQGVINIITRHPADEAGTTFATRMGNNGVRDWRLTGAQASDGRALRYTISEQSDHGYDDPDWNNRDDKRITRLNLRAVYEPDASQSFELLAGGSRSQVERPLEHEAFVEYLQLPTDHLDKAFLQLRWNREFSAAHQMRVQAYAQHSDGDLEFAGCFTSPLGGAPATGAIYFTRELRDLFESQNRDADDTMAAFVSRMMAADPSDPLVQRWMQLETSGLPPLCAAVGFDIEETRYDLEVENTLLMGDRARLVAGVNLRHDRAVSKAWLNGTAENVSRRLFGNLELRLTRMLRADLGGYWERDDINGGNFSGRGALIFSPRPAHSFRLVAAEALRTMDIYERRANVQLRPRVLSGPYVQDSMTWLGWNTPQLFALQTAQAALDPERIQSRELGYFGQMGPLEVDVRVFREELRDLVSGASNIFVFRLDNDAEVDIEGREIQLGWRPHPRHLIRATAAHIHTRARHPRKSTRSGLLRLAPRESASLLWQWNISQRWDFSTAGYLAHDYNDHPYERLDGRLRWRQPLAGQTRLELSLVAQHDMADEPVVFDENLYRDETRYWLSAALTFL